MSDEPSKQQVQDYLDSLPAETARCSFKRGKSKCGRFMMKADLHTKCGSCRKYEWDHKNPPPQSEFQPCDVDLVFCPECEDWSPVQKAAFRLRVMIASTIAKQRKPSQTPERETHVLSNLTPVKSYSPIRHPASADKDKDKDKSKGSHSSSSKSKTHEKDVAKKTKDKGTSSNRSSHKSESSHKSKQTSSEQHDSKKSLSPEKDKHHKKRSRKEDSPSRSRSRDRHHSVHKSRSRSHSQRRSRSKQRSDSKHRSRSRDSYSYRRSNSRDDSRYYRRRSKSPEERRSRRSYTCDASYYGGHHSRRESYCRRDKRSYPDRRYDQRDERSYPDRQYDQREEDRTYSRRGRWQDYDSYSNERYSERDDPRSGEQYYSSSDHYERYYGDDLEQRTSTPARQYTAQEPRRHEGSATFSSATQLQDWRDRSDRAHSPDTRRIVVTTETRPGQPPRRDVTAPEPNREVPLLQSSTTSTSFTGQALPTATPEMETLKEWWSRMAQDLRTELSLATRTEPKPPARRDPSPSSPAAGTQYEDPSDTEAHSAYQVEDVDSSKEEEAQESSSVEEEGERVLLMLDDQGLSADWQNAFPRLFSALCTAHEAEHGQQPTDTVQVNSHKATTVNAFMRAFLPEGDVWPIHKAPQEFHMDRKEESEDVSDQGHCPPASFVSKMMALATMALQDWSPERIQAKKKDMNTQLFAQYKHKDFVPRPRKSEADEHTSSDTNEVTDDSKADKWAKKPKPYFIQLPTGLWGKASPLDFTIPIPHTPSQVPPAGFEALSYKKRVTHHSVPQEVLLTIQDVLSQSLYVTSRNDWIRRTIEGILRTLEPNTETGTVTLPLPVRDMMLSLLHDHMRNSERTVKASVPAHANLTLIQREAVIKGLTTERKELKESGSEKSSLRYASDEDLDMLRTAPLFAKGPWSAGSIATFVSACEQAKAQALSQPKFEIKVNAPANTAPANTGKRRRKPASPAPPAKRQRSVQQKPPQQRQPKGSTNLQVSLSPQGVKSVTTRSQSNQGTPKRTYAKRANKKPFPQNKNPRQ